MLESQIQIFGTKAETPNAKAVLNGQLNTIEGIHPDLEEMLPFLITPEAIRQGLPITETLQMEEYK